MSDPITIPPDATDDQLRQLETDARAMLRSRECPAWLRGGSGCTAGAVPHDQHQANTHYTDATGQTLPTIVYWANTAAGEGQ